MANSKKIKIYGFLFITAIILLAFAVHYINGKIPSVIIDSGQINDKAAATENESPASLVKVPTAETAATTSKATAPTAGATAPTAGATAPAPKAPSLLNLPIPFTPQAPTGNWDLLHNEACEEASAIMANAYLIGGRETVIPAARVEKEISGLTAWLDQRFNYHLNTTAEETARMIEGFYGLKTEIFNDYALQDIKDQINSQHVVILPVNGRVIGNPNYKQPGPIYHMLIIRGYTAAGLITNDSGTRLGQNYPYAFKTLHKAGADWDHKTNTIDQSKKIMIVVSK